MEQTRKLLGSHRLRFIASSELAVECFHASDVLLPNLRANVVNARLIRELGADKMIVGTDGPGQVTAGSLGPIARALAGRTRGTVTSRFWRWRAVSPLCTPARKYQLRVPDTQNCTAEAPMERLYRHRRKHLLGGQSP